MKAYRFRLDSVLRVRQLQERVAAQQLAVAIRELHCARSELAQARRALAGLTVPAGRLTVGDVQWIHAQSGRMSESERRTAEQAEAAEETARRATDAWGTARQRTAMLERLDERHLATWRAEFEHSEAVALDDLSTGGNGEEGRAR